MEKLKPDVLGKAPMDLIRDLVACLPIEPKDLAEQAGWTPAKLAEWLALPSPSDLNEWFTILVILIGVAEEDGEVILESSEDRSEVRRYRLPSTAVIGEASAVESSAEILLECMARAAVIIADYRKEVRDGCLKIASRLAGRLGQSHASIEV